MNKLIPLLIAALFLLPRFVIAGTITIGVGEWPPFTSQQDDQARIAQRIATEAFALEGIRTVYRYYPWSRCYLEAKTGQIDATLPWFHSEKREKDFLYSQQPLLPVKDVFFHLKKTHFHWNGFADLKKYRLGGTLGYFDTTLLEQHGLTLDTVPEEHLNFRKMLVGRIDAYATSQKVGTYLIHKLFKPSVAAKFTYDPKPLDEAEGFVLFSRKIPNGKALRQAFDRGMKRLKQSGRYKEIIAGP